MRIKKFYNHKEQPTFLTDSFTMEGLIQLKISNEDDLSAQKAIKSMITNECLLRKLKDSLSNLINDFEIVANRMKQISIYIQSITYPSAKLKGRFGNN